MISAMRVTVDIVPSAHPAAQHFLHAQKKPPPVKDLYIGPIQDLKPSQTLE